MATRADLPKDLVAACIDQKIASTKRAINTATNELIKTALKDELAQLSTGRNTLTDIK